ncbi:hypothetical protein [Cellulomonas hominis]|uniref:hypothetical protein n=1 Tax=Cellulomonas hominis TaxID=156981 RepID=UPI001B8E80F4|nr:hypothetical protein [Cellulomonas hominis]VTR77236.1 hypothetical protein CHMI_02006 [Cellulomonas hominis]
MSEANVIKRPKVGGRDLRVRQATGAARTRLRLALDAQNGDGTRDVREEHARTEALNAALNLLSAIGQPVRAPRGPHRFATPGPAARPVKVVTELVGVSLTPREVANVRAALGARQVALGRLAEPGVELYVAAMARVESKVRAAGARRWVTVTALPIQRRASSKRDAEDVVDLLGAVAAGADGGTDPDIEPWVGVADQLASIEDVAVLRQLLADVTARVTAADMDAS